jgi:acyl-coenzyme A thioesterase PaaI-like protein
MSIQEKIKNSKAVTVHESERSFVSGDIIDGFIQTKYYFDESNGYLYAMVNFGNLAKGPPGHVHGGAIAAVLDEAMGANAWMNRLHSMTAQLKINYLKAVKLNQLFFIETWISEVSGKKILIKGKLIDESETIYAETESLFIKQGKEKFHEMGKMPDELFKYMKK